MNFEQTQLFLIYRLFSLLILNLIFQQNCDEKYKVFGPNSSQIIKLTSDTINCTKISINEVEYLQCICIAEFKTSRERWWFLAAANCKSNKGLDLYYNLTLLNNRTEWLKHFSADEYGILFFISN